MPSFTISAVDKQNQTKAFTYNTDTCVLADANGVPVVPEAQAKKHFKPAYKWNKDNPAFKTKDIRRLKIQLGLKCNYECNYCSQRFIPHAEDGTPDLVEPFINKMDSWFYGGTDGLGTDTKIEFWGGEPFVYWKTIKPLAEGIRKKYPNAVFTIITNGSLLDDEKIQWLIDLDFNVGLSHDGPGYHVRGLDPLDDEEKREAILKLFNILAPQGKMSINAMVHKDNPSRAKIQSWLENVFGQEYLRIGEGAFIDAYDEGGMESSLTSYEDHVKFRLNAYREITAGQANRFGNVMQKIEHVIDHFAHRAPIESISQKCGIDSPHDLTVDLNGNVITCQNVSAASMAMNGESHLAGHVDEFESIRVKSITHWSHRKDCPSCPVVHACRGSCTFADGEYFEASCNNSYSDNVASFAAAFEAVTGCAMFYIDGDFREDRKDIYGLVNGIPEEKPSKKSFPIPVVSA
jgi:uncharacterized protein